MKVESARVSWVDGQAPSSRLAALQRSSVGFSTISALFNVER